ncbi:MAG TPA: wax ester/triacylglycerol synthase family O-acyltransferase [Solirubrobacteraceae bacterium]|jgi:WS/DGAT/MGAT family acyltransferase|nr:wax ester/triacylglycerol synthase family O-acyltransferase [Solirubrobacteraceae bacterium]
MSKHQMNSADAAWLHMDRPTNLMVVNSVLWFDEPMDLGRTRAVVQERLVERFPRFRQRIAEPRLGLGVPAWEDDPGFDLGRHLHHIALPAPGDRAALQDLVGDLISTPLDRSKPLWDIYVIDGYGSGAALVTRMHHCIADGIALARVLLSMTDEHPDAGIARADHGPGDHHRPSAVARSLATGVHVADAAVHEGVEILSHPMPELRGLAGRTVADARALGKLLLTPPDKHSALRGPLGVPQKVSWTDEVMLQDVKAIGHATGTTVNDVLVTAMTGALHRHLVRRHSTVDELRAMVPFNLRPLDQPLPRELGNRFGLVYLRLPVGLRGRRRRLQEVHRRMEAIKHSPEGAVAYGILGLIGLTPPQVERRLVDVFSTKCTLILTNVPGPRRPVYLAGTRLAGVVGWVPAGGSVGLGLSIFSFGERVTVGVRADAGLVPDPDALIDAFTDELSQLSKLSPRSASPRAPAPAA